MKKKKKQRKLDNQAMEEGIDISTSNQPLSVAKNVWDFGKELELNCNFEEGEMIGELTKIEKRDRLKANFDSGKLKDVGMVTNCGQ
ncbi:hypothetical protein A2U01_0046268 [Trifolium medium]|uniref:Uncharacterized protein n=1 Tax=Trifolium medium TaxID=97028 RepID=A0A392QN43_9FABA|nr:hypothetical protein [Trifolium medium]